MTRARMRSGPGSEESGQIMPERSPWGVITMGMNDHLQSARVKVERKIPKLPRQA